MLVGTVWGRFFFFFFSPQSSFILKSVQLPASVLQSVPSTLKLIALALANTMALWELVFLENEPYLDYIRKLTVIIAGLLSAFLAIVIIPARIVVTDEWHAAAIVLLTGTVVGGLPSLALVYLVFTKRISALLVHMCMVGLAVWVTTSMLANPTTNVRFHCSLLFYFIYTTKLSPKLPYLLGGVVVFGISCWNDAIHMTDVTIGLAPNATMPPVPQHLYVPHSTHTFDNFLLALFLQYFGDGLPCLAGGVAIWFQTRHHFKMLDASTAGVALSQSVVEKLHSFDTDGAKSTLDLAKKDGVVDEGLIAGLEQMRSQLDTYQPFLPNWVLMQQKQEEDDTRSAIRSSEMNNSSVRNPFGLSASHASDSRPVPALESDAAGRSPINRQLEADRESDLSDISDFSDTVRTFDMGENRTSILGSSFGLPLAGSQLDSELSHRVISAALIDFGAFPSPTQTFDIDGESYFGVLNAVLEDIHSLANHHFAAVHHTVGDRAMLTWGAMVSVAQPEVHACRYLMMLREKFDSSSASIGGAVCTGPAWCAFHALKTTKRHETTIKIPWQRGLEGMCQLAVSHAAPGRKGAVFLSDGRTYETARYEVEARMVDRLAWERDSRSYLSQMKNPTVVSSAVAKASLSGRRTSPSPRAASILKPSNPSNSFRQQASGGNLTNGVRNIKVYELVRLHVASRTEEWMYAIANDEMKASDSALVTKATLAYFEGQFNDALEAIGKISDKSVIQSSSMLTLLAERVENGPSDTGLERSISFVST